MIGRSVAFARPVLREPRKGDPIRATEYADLVRAVRQIQAQDPQVFRNRMRLDILSFWMRMESSTVCRINKGTFQIAGDLKVSVAETTKTLSSDPTWIYLRHEWGSSTASIETKADEPNSNSTYYEHPFGKYEATNGVYSMTDWRWMGGDIILASPLRGGGA